MTKHKPMFDLLGDLIRIKNQDGFDEQVINVKNGSNRNYKMQRKLLFLNVEIKDSLIQKMGLREENEET